MKKIKYLFFGLIGIFLFIALIESASWIISTFTYDNQKIDITSRSNDTRSIFFSQNGTFMYIAGGGSYGESGDGMIFQYTLSTAWDISTATYNGINFNASSQDRYPEGLYINSSGTKMFIAGQGGSPGQDKIFQYTLSTAWDISSASYDNVNYVLGEVNNPVGLFVNSSGTQVYTIIGSNCEISEVTLSQAWNLSSNISNTTTLHAYGTYDCTGMFVNSSGNGLYLSNKGSDTINYYSLSEPWNLSSHTTEDSLDVSTLANNPSGIFLKPTGNRLFVLNYTQIISYSASVIPTISNIYPTNNKNFSTSSVNFTILPYDEMNLSGLNVTIYGNWSGSWTANLSNSSSFNNTNTTINVTGIPNGKFIWTSFVNNTLNASLNGTNWTFSVDTTPPQFDLNSINVSTTAGSQTFTFEFNVSDAVVGVNRCWYSILLSNYSVDSATIENTSVNCNSTGNSETANSLGNRVLRIWSNDSLNNRNYTDKNFTLSTLPLPPGGGGGSSIYPLSLAKNFTITTMNLKNLLDMSLAKNSTKPRKNNFLLINKDLTKVNVKIECNTENVNKSSRGINICDYVSFSNNTFTVPPNEQDRIVGEFSVKTPIGADFGEKYYFNIIAVEQGKNEYSKLSVKTEVTYLAMLYRWNYFPFQNAPDEEKKSYPVTGISLILSLTLFIVSLVIFRKFKMNISGFFFSLGIFIISFILFLISL